MEIFDSIFPSSMEAFFADFLYAKYAAAFFGVFLAAGITFWLIRRISDLLIATVLIGAFLIVCYELTNGSISTWGEVAGASIALGILASIVCIPVLPFSSSLMNQYGRFEQPRQPEENPNKNSIAHPPLNHDRNADAHTQSNISKPVSGMDAGRDSGKERGN